MPEVPDVKMPEMPVMPQAPDVKMPEIPQQPKPPERTDEDKDNESN